MNVSWTKPDGSSGQGHAILLTKDTGYFWFFDSANIELVVKVLDGRGLNGKYWFFGAGLTNLKVVITVTNGQSGAVKTYLNPQGSAFQPVQDTSAFAAAVIGGSEPASRPLSAVGEY